MNERKLPNKMQQELDELANKTFDDAMNLVAACVAGGSGAAGGTPIKCKCPVVLTGLGPCMAGDMGHAGPHYVQTPPIQWIPDPAGSSVETAAMYDIPDPLQAPLYPAKPADWAGKVKRVEWARANLTPGELAYLYKLSHDADGLRRADCDEKMKKEGWRP